MSDGKLYELKRRIRLLEGRGAQRLNIRATLDMNGNRLKGLPAPVDDADPVTKGAAEVTYSPIGAEYLVVTANGALTDERIFSAGANIAFVDGGAGKTLTISATADDSEARAFAYAEMWNG